MIRYDADGPTDDPVAAAAHFHREHLYAVEAVLREGRSVAIVLPPANREHREWREAVAAMLARRYAPLRCNAVTGANVGPLVSYLESAKAITGQYLVAD